MLMFVIQTALVLSALYCGGAWVWLCYLGIRNHSTLTDTQHSELESGTFHLGLCFILSTGFLGLLQG